VSGEHDENAYAGNRCENPREVEPSCGTWWTDRPRDRHRAPCRRLKHAVHGDAACDLITTGLKRRTAAHRGTSRQRHDRRTPELAKTLPRRADTGRTPQYWPDLLMPLTWTGWTWRYLLDDVARFYTPAVGGSIPSAPTDIHRGSRPKRRLRCFAPRRSRGANMGHKTCVAGRNRRRCPTGAPRTRSARPLGIEAADAAFPNDRYAADW
jgi:hypothetical protein